MTAYSIRFVLIFFISEVLIVQWSYVNFFLYQPHIYKRIIGIVILNISKDVLSYNLERLATYVIMLNLKNSLARLDKLN